MARNRTSATAASGKPRAKRQSGYVVTIKGFVPVGTTFQEQRTALDAMEAASNGNADAAIKLMTGVEIASKLTTRTIDAPAASGPDV